MKRLSRCLLAILSSACPFVSHAWGHEFVNGLALFECPEHMNAIGTTNGYNICAHGPGVKHWPSYNAICDHPDAVWYAYSKVCVVGGPHKRKPINNANIMMIKGDPAGPIRGDTAEPRKQEDISGIVPVKDYKYIGRTDRGNVYGMVSSRSNRFTIAEFRILAGANEKDRYKNAYDCKDNLVNYNSFEPFSKAIAGTVSKELLDWACNQANDSSARAIDTEGFAFLAKDDDRDFYARRVQRKGGIATIEVRFFKEPKDTSQYMYRISYDCDKRLWSEYTPSEYSSGEKDPSIRAWSAVPPVDKKQPSVKSLEYRYACK